MTSSTRNRRTVVRMRVAWRIRVWLMRNRRLKSLEELLSRRERQRPCSQAMMMTLAKLKLEQLCAPIKRWRRPSRSWKTLRALMMTRLFMRVLVKDKQLKVVKVLPVRKTSMMSLLVRSEHVIHLRIRRQLLWTCAS